MPAPDQTLSSLLDDASHRVVRSVDSMGDDAWHQPSLLPGWSRSHLVAHLTLNAEGLAAALTGILTDRQVPMYASQDARDGDIEQLAAADPSRLRNRFLGSVTDLSDAVEAVPDDQWSTTIERDPGGRTFHADAIPGMRLREIEIHHADLALGYTQASWTADFAVRLLDAMTKRDAGAAGFRVNATDLDRAWLVGEGGPTVSGTAADLGWWLTGRGDGAGLTSDDGELPGIGAW